MRILINLCSSLKHSLAGAGHNCALTNEGIIFFFSVSLIALNYKNKKNILYIVLENWQLYFQKTYAFIIFILTKGINNMRCQQFFPSLYSSSIGITFLILLTHCGLNDTLPVFLLFNLHLLKVGGKFILIKDYACIL